MIPPGGSLNYLEYTDGIIQTCFSTQVLWEVFIQYLSYYSAEAFPSCVLELSKEEVDEYYSPKDFQLGHTLTLLGRRFLLYDCDGFTRDYFHTNHPGMDMKPTEVPTKDTLIQSRKKVEALLLLWTKILYIYIFLSSYSDTAHLLFIYRPFLPTMASDHLRILFRIVCPWFLSLLKRTSWRCWKMTTKFCATVPGWWVHRHSCDLLCVSAFVLQSKTCWIHITFYYTDLGFMSLLRFYDLTVKLLEPCSRVSSRGCFVLSSKSSIHS